MRNLNGIEIQVCIRKFMVEGRVIVVGTGNSNVYEIYTCKELTENQTLEAMNEYFKKKEEHDAKHSVTEGG